MSQTDTHGISHALAQSELGHVSQCGCGVVTITLHYLSLRFEPAAFRELLAMLNRAQHQLESDPADDTEPRAPLSMDAPSVH
jgi:hypothetical protein